MKLLKAVIIGAGAIAESHIIACNGLKGRVLITAMADINIENANKLKQKYGLNAKVYADYKNMLEETELDFAIVCLPHFLHLEAAICCVKKGCHILMEKPMAMNVAECDQMIAAVNTKGLKLMIGHASQYLSETIAARKVVQSGQLGQLLMVNDFNNTSYFAKKRNTWFVDKKKSGGGIVMNHGAHSFDRVTSMTGREVKIPKATIQLLHPQYQIDGHAFITAVLEGEIPVHFTLYGYSTFYRNGTELYFTEGTLEVKYGEGAWIYSNGAKEKVDDLDGDLFERQLADFLDCLENKKEIPITGEYGRYILELIGQSCGEYGENDKKGEFAE